MCRQQPNTNTLQYDANQKDFLLSMLGTVGDVVDGDDEKDHKLATMMNMTQHAFVMRLNCIEQIKTDECINPYIVEDVKFTSAQHKQQDSEVPNDEARCLYHSRRLYYAMSSAVTTEPSR